MIKKIILTMFVFAFLAACVSSPEQIAAQTATAQTVAASAWTRTPTPTATQTPTSTLSPTLTPSLTPTPVPIGGGGRYYMAVDSRLVPDRFKTDNLVSWFSASSDGSKLKLVDWEIGSISPDGKQALKYTSEQLSNGYWIYDASLVNLDGTGEIPLDKTLTYSWDSTWLPNGDVILLADQKEGLGSRSKKAFYIVNPDGKLTKLEKPSKLIKKQTYFLLPSIKEDKFYWYTSCGSNSCKLEYYATNLHDYESTRIMKNVAGHQDMYLSPSGKYIIYLDNSYRSLNGCFLLNTADNTVTKFIPEDGSMGIDFCFGGNHWSPTEDILYGQGRNGFSIISIPDGKITTLYDTNDGSCLLVRWTPDGKHLFLSVCSKDIDYLFLDGGISLKYTDYIPSVGAMLINISNLKVTKYPNAGFCEMMISPDSNWVLFYACMNEKKHIVYPSKLLNLQTRKMFPLFEEFKDTNTDSQLKKYDRFYWKIFWLP